jgi:galactose oxidase-like protein
MKLSARVVVFAVLAVCSAIQVFAQHSLVSPSSRVIAVGSAGVPGRHTSGSTAESLVPGSPQWSSGFEASASTGLEGHTAVYDQASNTMIVFGGLASGLAFNDTNAVTLFAPATGAGLWSTLIANGTTGSPSARNSHSAVYDSANNRMIIFGGTLFSTGDDLNDVWVLSNANGQGGTASWTQLTPAGTPPTPRSQHTAVYDPINNVMTIFGGSDVNAVSLTDTWILSNANGLGGTPTWTKLSPTGSLPTGLSAHTAVYDASNNIMTVFSGANRLINAGTNGVYTLSHANGLGGAPVWTRIVANGAPGSPPKRFSPTAVYDAANNRMIIFGGGLIPDPRIGPGGLNDVWVLANANGLGGTPVWTKLKPTAGPPGTRFFHSAVYDSVNNQMVIYAGNNDEAVFYIAWVLSDANGL